MIYVHPPNVNFGNEMGYLTLSREEQARSPKFVYRDNGNKSLKRLALVLAINPSDRKKD